MKLTDWLDEYRNVPLDSGARRAADAEEDWVDEGLFAPDDRERDTTPRWLKRAERVGYGRASVI